MSEAVSDDIMTLVYTSAPPVHRRAPCSRTQTLGAMEKIINEPLACPTERARVPTTSSSPISRCATSPSGSSRPGPCAAGPSLNFAESIDTVTLNPREPADRLLRRPPHLGAPARRRLHPWQRCHPVQESALRPRYSSGSHDRQGEGRQRWRPHGEEPGPVVIGEPLVFRAIKERIGLRRCRYSASGRQPSPQRFSSSSWASVCRSSSSTA